MTKYDWCGAFAIQKQVNPAFVASLVAALQALNSDLFTYDNTSISTMFYVVLKLNIHNY